MRRTTLRRYIERLAITSLLGGGCHVHTQPANVPPASGDPSDAAVANGPVDGGDLTCPSTNDNCYWLAYVDGGVPSDNIHYWLGDGSVNPCPPCNLEAQPGAYCGSCQIVQNNCGIAYFCSILNCADY